MEDRDVWKKIEKNINNGYLWAAERWWDVFSFFFIFLFFFFDKCVLLLQSSESKKWYLKEVEIRSKWAINLSFMFEDNKTEDLAQKRFIRERSIIKRNYFVLKPRTFFEL